MLTQPDLCCLCPTASPTHPTTINGEARPAGEIISECATHTRVQHTHVSVLLNISDVFSAQTVSLINTDLSADLDFSVDVPRSPAATRSGLQEEPEVSSLRGTSKRGCVLCADCECSAAGTVENSCRADPRTGTCICKPGFTGDHCDACAPGFYGLSCEGETCTFKPNTSGTSPRLHETHELHFA